MRVLFAAVALLWASSAIATEPVAQALTFADCARERTHDEVRACIDKFHAQEQETLLRAKEARRLKYESAKGKPAAERCVFSLPSDERFECERFVRAEEQHAAELRQKEEAERQAKACVGLDQKATCGEDQALCERIFDCKRHLAKEAASRFDGPRAVEELSKAKETREQLRSLASIGYTARLCVAEGWRDEAMDAIKAERSRSKIGGVINLRIIDEAQWEAQRWTKNVQAIEAEMRRQKLKRMSCDFVDVLAAAPCVTDTALTDRVIENGSVSDFQAFSCEGPMMKLVRHLSAVPSFDAE